MIIKICGLCTADHALVAADAGADMIGLVFASSRRQVSIEQAAMIAAAVRARSLLAPKLVGLFVNTPCAVINTVTHSVGLDLVQLSGDETFEQAKEIDRPVIKSIRMDGSAREAAWLESGVRLLVDAHVVGAYGGTGARADWSRAAALAQHVPLILAGGLDSENVAEAITQVQPWGVDVSSGVEEGGRKSVAKIRTFIATARGVSWL
ncbi:MAG: phosphoribosylanthranilate isomerase [Oscillochloris sp.]|nr:phosphoribosylanthranilate isomerase [Oscillochloris sp.]